MYKNFNLTDEERKQIMEMHQTHGYKKPLVEQEEEDETETGLSLESFVSLRVESYGTQINYNDELAATVTLQIDEDGNIVDVMVDFMYADEDELDEETVINFVKEKIQEGHFDGVPISVSYNLDSDDFSSF
jgi:uncharacterized protein YkvS